MDTPEFNKNLAALKDIDGVNEIVVYGGPDGRQAILTLPNMDGKKGSLKVVANAMGFEDGFLGRPELQTIYDGFREYKEIARADPLKHPTPEFFRMILESGQDLRAVIHFKVPGDLEGRVRELNIAKGKGALNAREGELVLSAYQAFNEVADLVEKGHIRVAEWSAEGWKVNDWVKQGLTFAFPLGDMINYGPNNTDKNTLSLRKIAPETGIRAVPPSSAMRRGSYAGRGVTLMPPAYVNLGAFVGRDTMAESLVASCAQVGRSCHLSAGSIIGGVLDPMEATPCILEDMVLLGEGSGISQGTRLGRLVTIAPGVHISKGTPVIDPINMKAYTKDGTFEIIEVGMEMKGLTRPWSPHVYKIDFMRQVNVKPDIYGPEVPAGALIVPGVYVSRNGGMRVAPTVAKFIKSAAERAYALNNELRKND